MGINDIIVNISVTGFLISGLIIFIVSNRRVDSQTNKYFIIYTLVVCLLLFFDAWEYYLGSLSKLNEWRYFTTAMCYTLRAVAITVINILLRLRQPHKKHFFLWLPAIVLAIFTITNRYTKWICFFSQDNRWHGGTLRFLPHIISGICLLILIVQTVLIHRKAKSEVGVLFAFIILINIFGTVIETMFNVRFLLTGAMAVSCLLYYSIVSKENEAARKIKHEQELANSKIAIMLSQIQPHFIYNALNTIEYLCDTQPLEASVAIRKFSKYLRVNMDSLTQKAPISIEQELNHIDNYLHIEKLRFPKIEIKYAIACKEIFLPTLTLQPLVENAIKHAFKNKKSQGIVTISTWEDQKNNYACVEDNGDGFIVGVLPEDDRNHIGIENTKKRVRNISQGTLVIESTIGVGTRAIITLPKEVSPCI